MAIDGAADVNAARNGAGVGDDAAAPPRNPDPGGAGGTQPEASWSDLLFACAAWNIPEPSGAATSCVRWRRAICAARGGGDAPRDSDRVSGASNDVCLCAIGSRQSVWCRTAGMRIARDSGNIIVIAGGRPTAGLAARDLICLAELDSADFSAAVAAILKLKPKFKIDTVNGEPALNSAWVSELAAMRFHSDGRSLIYDGLPGPMPARAAAIAAAKSGASRMDG